jgi:hypothetical protein
MNRPDLTYAQRGDAAPGDEVAALRNIYKFIIDCHATKEATHPVSCEEAIRLLLAFGEKEGGSAPALDNAKVRSMNDSRARESIREND